MLARWKTYLAKPEESHPLLNRWFQGGRTDEEANRFQKLMLEIIGEKKLMDEENKRLVEAGNKAEPKVARTIVLPGGYRSEEDFNPGAYIPSKSLERDKFVAYNLILNDASAPLKFDRELTIELLGEEGQAEYRRMQAKAEVRKKLLAPQYAFLQGAGESVPWDVNLNIRGNPEALGEVVPRRFPDALSGKTRILFNQGSGRLQLADGSSPSAGSTR
ncbi:MAG: hypothetical protein WKF37_19650 [Bryobacteraceae bacterium]